MLYRRIKNMFRAFICFFCWLTISPLFTEEGKCFEGVDKKKCIVRVPKGSVDLYKTAYEWKEFENIVEQ